MGKETPQPEGLGPLDIPLSQVVVSDGLVYTAGQVAHGADFSTEADEVLRRLGTCLAAAGCSYDDVLKVNVYLVDMADFPVFNDIYRRYFSAPFPARTTVRADLVPGYRVEVDAVARVPT